MNELQKIVQELQRLSEEPVTKESYAKMLELFQAFVSVADKQMARDDAKDLGQTSSPASDSEKD